MKVREWMTPDPFTLTEGDRVKTAVQDLLRAGIRHVPILRGGTLVGIVTDRDLRRALPSVEAGASPEKYQAFMEQSTLGDQSRVLVDCVRHVPPRFGRLLSSNAVPTSSRGRFERSGNRARMRRHLREGSQLLGKTGIS